MRANWLTLLGVNLRSIFMAVQSSRKKKRHAGFVVMMIIYALVGLLFAFYCGLTAYAYVLMGMADIVMPIMMTMASILILFTTIFKSNGFLFASRDDEFLLSLPIRTHEIIIGRIGTLYLFELAETIMIMAAPLIVLAVMTDVSAGFVFLGAVSIVFIPLIPLALSALIGIVITFISSRFKYKNAVTIILGMVVLVVIMGFSMSAQNIDETMFLNMNQMILQAITQLYFPANLYISGLNGSAAAYAVFVLLSVGIMLAVTALITFKYKSITTLLNTGKSKGTYHMETLKTSGFMMALYKKELKFYTSFSVYVMNTAFSFVLMIVAAVAIFFVQDIEGFLQIPKADQYITSLLPAILALFMSLSSTTYPCISLEGNHLWLMNHLPVRDKDIYDAKLLLNLSLAIPSALIASILFIIRFKPDMIIGIMTITVPLAYGLFMAVFGLFANLKFPNFQWINPTSVVKQGTPSMITTLGGMLISIIAAILIFTFISLAPIIYGILTAALLLSAFLLYRNICTISLKSLSD